MVEDHSDIQYEKISIFCADDNGPILYENKFMHKKPRIKTINFASLVENNMNPMHIVKIIA